MCSLSDTLPKFTLISIVIWRSDTRIKLKTEVLKNWEKNKNKNKEKYKKYY